MQTSAMKFDHTNHSYINGVWVEPRQPRIIEVVNPATEMPVAKLALAGRAEVDDAVFAARTAFVTYSGTSREQRLALLSRIRDVYQTRWEDLAVAVSAEMGAPMELARKSHAAAGLQHLDQIIQVLKAYDFDEEMSPTTIVTREPIGVCALITPWNWPINQVACKVLPALAAGCTMVLKPSEISPLSALIFAEILDEAGVPAGVFNLVNGDGPTVGQALAEHPDVDMISFTGSTRAGIQVSKVAADTVKRVALELGGKSPNIILDDADIAATVSQGVKACFNNSGQTCTAPTRMLVPASRREEALKAASEAAAETQVGSPQDAATTIGPVATRNQFEKIQSLIAAGIEEGASLIAGGLDRPGDLETGFYVQATVFADVTSDMTIAQEEIFGPVLCIMFYDTEEDAIRMANDTVYGLSCRVSSGSRDRARAVARQIRAGLVHINGAPAERSAPFGGYKRSGNGREWGRYGFEDYLEVKSIFGFNS